MKRSELKQIIREVIEECNFHLYEEDVIKPSDKPNTMCFWHGGNLDDYDPIIAHKKGRFEYGAGLYLTTSYNVVQNYKKGSRKLYFITVNKGNDINDVNIPLDKCVSFINDHCVKPKRIEMLDKFNYYQKDGYLEAKRFNLLLLNYDAIKPSKTKDLRDFLISNGVDYDLVDNPFGWGEKMLVLYNMKLIDSIKHITSKDKIEEFDLPTKWK